MCLYAHITNLKYLTINKYFTFPRQSKTTPHTHFLHLSLTHTLTNTSTKKHTEEGTSPEVKNGLKNSTHPEEKKQKSIATDGLTSESNILLLKILSQPFSLNSLRALSYRAETVKTGHTHINTLSLTQNVVMLDKCRTSLVKNLSLNIYKLHD